jgi:hypothetical protein
MYFGSVVDPFDLFALYDSLVEGVLKIGESHGLLRTFLDGKPVIRVKIIYSKIRSFNLVYQTSYVR